MRRLFHRALVGVVLCLAAGGAGAAEDSRDRAVIEAAVKAALERQKKGASAAWSNPETGSGGTITMQRSLFRDGKPCRQYVLTVERGGSLEESVTGVGCRTEDGGWRLEQQGGAESGSQQAGGASATAATGAALVPASLPSAGARRIEAGETFFVNVWAYRTPPGLTRGDLFVKERVFSQELLETHPEDGALHVNLLDGAKIRLGANCQVRLDEFLYDPGSGAGKVTASIGRGIARFITGKVTGDNFQVRTPTALIGVRGTDFIVAVAATGATVVHVISGQVRVTLLRASIVQAVLAGQTLGVRRDGATITNEVAVPQDPGLEEAAGGGDESESGGEDLRRRSSIPGVGAGSRPRVQPPRRQMPKIGHHH